MLMESAFSASTENGILGLAGEVKKLKNKLSTEKRKLRIDEEDHFEDAMSYYKNPNFHPSTRLRICHNGQAAVDTGGVTRQFFTQLLQTVGNTFFEGDEYKIPMYNSNTVATGIMKLVGTIIVHSVLMDGPGFPVFSLAVYNYLCHGDVSEAVKSVTVGDCSSQVTFLVKKVSCF